MVHPWLPKLTLEGPAPGMPQALAALWERLRDPIAQSIGASGALSDLSQEPSDPDVIAALRVQLRKLIQSDTALKMEIEQLLDYVRACKPRQVVLVAPDVGDLQDDLRGLGMQVISTATPRQMALF